MERKIQIFSSLLLLLVSHSFAAPRQTVFDDILDTLKNIEDLIRGSSEPSIYLSNSAGRSVASHAPHFVHSRDVLLHVDPFEERDVHGHLHFGLRGSRSANVNSNSNSNVNQNQRFYDDDDRLGRPFPRHVPKLKRRPRIQERPLDDDVSSNANSNVNSNSNSNSNINSNAADVTPGSDAKSSLKIKTGRTTYGARSLSRSRNNNINRNVNTNVNTNGVGVMEDEDFDEN